MKRILLGMACALSALASMAQSDPVVMRINGKNVTRSEFEYNFNKNNSEAVVDKKSIDEYAELFINYKLKVEAALDAHLDTLSSYQREFRQYRDQQVRPMLVPSEAEEQECKNYYAMMQSNIGDAGLVRPAHIFIYMPQTATAEQQAEAKARIDSIWLALQAGEPFDTLAVRHSQDGSAKRGGDLGWLVPKQTVKEFEDVVFAMQKDALHEPFLSTFGWHIVKLLDRKQLEPYDELKPQIHAFLMRQGLKERLAQQVADSLAKADGLTMEQLMDRETDRLIATDNDLRYLVQEYHDGLLLYELMNSRVWTPAQNDEAGMEKYFKKNKKKYAWSKPRFIGAGLSARTEEQLSSAKTLLKKVKDETQWADTIKATFNKDSVCVRMEYKLFKQGDNKQVDYDVFGKGEAPLNASRSFLYRGCVGRVLKKGPKYWTDVRGDVATDYQAAKEQEFVTELRRRYSVEKMDDALKTVNQH